MSRSLIALLTRRSVPVRAASRLFHRLLQRLVDRLAHLLSLPRRD
jgi:hypothetical protein